MQCPRHVKRCTSRANDQAQRGAWHTSCWAVIGQLRHALGQPDASLRLQQGEQLLPPELATGARSLSAAEWVHVFALNSCALLEPPLPLPTRAACPEDPAQWLALLRAVDTAALATFVLCNALPLLCR